MKCVSEGDKWCEGEGGGGGERMGKGKGKGYGKTGGKKTGISIDCKLYIIYK